MAGAVALAGCATGYAYVQPNLTGSGGYYTSDNAYTGQGYYDYYGTGPYYPGTSGWGYYNGTLPYAGALGWYGGGYYGYGSPFIFNLGISNVWGFPGYWGPWYSLGFPIWGCWNGCRHHHHHRHGHWQHAHWHGQADPGQPDAVIAHLTPPPGLRPEHLRVAPRWQRGAARPLPDFAARRPLASASFAPHERMRVPIQRQLELPRFNGMATRRAWSPPVPESRAFAPDRIAPPVAMRPTPYAAPAPQAVFRAAPAPTPPARTSRAPAVKIR